MPNARPPRSKALTWTRNTAIILIACYVAILVFVQVNERIARHRAEQLLSAMRSLEPGKSTWSDLEAIRNRWGAWGNYEGSCTPAACDFHVSLADVPGPWGLAAFLSTLGHGHMAIASLQVSLQQGLVRYTSYGLWVSVPKGYGPRWERAVEAQDLRYIPYATARYELVANAASRPEIAQRCCYWPGHSPHPDYTVRNPDGCLGCLGIRTEFLPSASTADKLRATNFNFDCINRWTPCADEQDIMPQAGAELAQELELRKIENERKESCAYSASELSTAAVNAAVVQVIPTTPTERSQEDVTLRPLKQLGGSVILNPLEPLHFEASTDRPEAKIIAQALAGKKQVIVLYPQAPQQQLFEPYICGVLADSEPLEALVNAAVALGKGFPESE